MYGISAWFTIWQKKGDNNMVNIAKSQIEKTI